MCKYILFNQSLEIKGVGKKEKHLGKRGKTGKVLISDEFKKEKRKEFEMNGGGEREQEGE